MSYFKLKLSLAGTIEAGESADKLRDFDLSEEIELTLTINDCLECDLVKLVTNAAIDTLSSAIRTTVQVAINNA